MSDEWAYKYAPTHIYTLYNTMNVWSTQRLSEIIVVGDNAMIFHELVLMVC